MEQAARASDGTARCDFDRSAIRPGARLRPGRRRVASARDHAALPSDEDVIAGLREARAYHRIGFDTLVADRGDPRPLAERQRDWAITGFVPEQQTSDS